MKLNIIVRDISPFIFMQEPVEHRLVVVELTEEQEKAIALRKTGHSNGQDYYEEISNCFLDKQAREKKT